MPLSTLSPRILAALVICSILTGCGGGSGSEGSVIPDINSESGDFADLRAYKTSGEYAEVMLDCVKAATSAESCTLNRLPIIGMEIQSPTTADIMDRVLVSHDWMGTRFEQALNNLPADIRLLLRATTAVVIDADIRPAYYTTVTGAIYLDPAYLWLTSAELATISTQPDHRAGYSDPLQFRSLARYVQNNQYIYGYGLLEENPSKTMDDVKLLIGNLLYHELAHANDFLPPSSWDFLNPNNSISQAIADNENNFVAKLLFDTDPLTSNALYALGEVMYWGATPTEADLSITATQVGDAFEPDGASDHYAYASPFEDSAMLFEEAMMKYHFGVDRDVAFTEAPDDPQFCDGYIIGWGVRNRLGDTDVKARAQLVADNILPSASADMTQFFQDMAAPQAMTVGANWCDTLTMSAPLNLDAQKTKVQSLPPRDLTRPHEVRF